MVVKGANSIFFSLLRSGMYGIPLPESELPENIDWETVITLARKHVVLGIIIESIQFLPEQLRPSSSVSAKISKFALGLIQTNMVMDNVIARLVTFFNQHGIDGVLLKGQGVAQYYRMPQMRQCGDIDYYVGKANYKRAVDLCQQNLIDDTNSCHESEQHFVFYLNGIAIELHRLATAIYSPFRNRRFQRWIIAELEQSGSRRATSFGNTAVTLPSYDFDAIFIFYHAWRHYIMGGIGLRQLCDWAMIFHSHSHDIDTEKLKENISRFGLTKGWKLFAYIAVHYLGISDAKIPLYDPSYSKRAEKILDEIITGGNFGFYSEAYTGIRKNGYGIRFGFGTLRNITKTFISLFPLIPIEATSFYLSRLFYGTASFVKRLIHKSHH